MKRTSFLAALITGVFFVSSANAQIYTPAGTVSGSTGQNVSVGANVASPWELHIEAPGTDAAPEKIIRTRVTDNYDFLDIGNLTNASGRYAPTLWAYRENYPLGSTGSPALTFQGTSHNDIDAEYSAGVSYPMMQFEVRKYQTDPTSSITLPSGTVSAISVRPLFDWSNNWGVKMRMDANGDLGIGTGTNSIGSRLVVTGEGTTSSTSALDVATSASSPLIHARNDGRVGIGTRTSGDLTGILNIKGAGSSSGIALYASNSGGTQTLKLTDDATLDIGTPTFNYGKVNTEGTAASGLTQAGYYATITGAAGSYNSYGAMVSASGTGARSTGVYATGSDADESNGGYLTANNGSATGSKEVYGATMRATVSGGTTGNLVYGLYSYASGIAGNTVYAGYFQGDVYATGSYLGSDQKLKMDILPYQGALDKIAQLDIKSYRYNSAQFPTMSLPEGQQIGLIAQNVEKVFPNLVKQTAQPPVRDDNGNIIHERVEFKAVNYTGLVPVLVEGIKEQQQEIEALKQEVAKLSTVVKGLSGNTTTTTGSATQLGMLFQNVPNPASTSTTIRYNLSPDAVREGNAEIVITDAQRMVELQRQAVAPGNGQIEVRSGTLRPGVYMYSLVVNGQAVDSKKMIIVP